MTDNIKYRGPWSGLLGIDQLETILIHVGRDESSE